MKLNEEKLQEYLDMVKKDTDNLKYIPINYRTYDIYLEVVRNDPKGILLVPKQFMKEELMIAALDKDPYNIRYTKTTAFLCEYAFSKNNNVYRFLPNNRKTQLMAYIVVKEDPMNIKYVPKIHQRKELISLALNKNISCIKYIKNKEDINNENIVCKKINNSKNKESVILYIRTLSKKRRQYSIDYSNNMTYNNLIKYIKDTYSTHILKCVESLNFV